MENTLAGKLLVAMPGMNDERFDHAVVYVCAHSEEGAMGLVINRPMPGMDFTRLLDHVGIEPHTPSLPIHVYLGGPVEPTRGFVLHSSDMLQDQSLAINDRFAMTATLEMLRAIADGVGPERSLLALGYTGWGPEQLEQEMKENSWLAFDADEELIFSPALDDKWSGAFRKAGIDPRFLSEMSGRA